MPKFSDTDRQIYLEKIKSYGATTDSLLKVEKGLLKEIKEKPADAAVKRLALVDEMLNLASNYIAINGVSQSVLKIKNEDALNDGRKSLYKSVIYLEEIVGALVDAPFSEYEEKLAAIAAVDANSRYLLARKMGLSIELLENAYTDNTKWKWSFVELEGRYAATVKNLIDLRSAVANTDPRSADYEPTLYHLRLAKKQMMQAADRYREKYELSTGRIGDFKSGINFLSALRRFHAMLGDRDEAEVIKKKLDIWTAKLENDLKKAEMSGSRKV
ncbi:MAG: hypothetical protein FWG99_11495 [Treponema sp.]|nr:hypothetical protein [Treponema sp.]